MAIQDAIERIQYHARLVTGVMAAPDNLDLSVSNNTAYVLTYLAGGSFGTEAANQGRDLHNIQAILTLEGGNEVELVRRSEGMLESFVNLLRGDVTLNDTVQTINGPITYTMTLTTEDNGVKLSYIITIPVKIRPVF
jgi:hypothetical protein